MGLLGDDSRFEIFLGFFVVFVNLDEICGEFFKLLPSLDLTQVLMF
jgi:hypothetical protein